MRLQPTPRSAATSAISIACSVSPSGGILCRDSGCGHGLQSCRLHIHSHLCGASPGVRPTGQNIPSPRLPDGRRHFRRLCRLDPVHDQRARQRPPPKTLLDKSCTTDPPSPEHALQAFVIVVLFPSDLKIRRFGSSKEIARIASWVCTSNVCGQALLSTVPLGKRRQWPDVSNTEFC